MSIKILVVEDDSKSRYLLVKIVENLGHVTVQSPNGKHAYDTLLYNKDIEHRKEGTKTCIKRLAKRNLVGCKDLEW